MDPRDSGEFKFSWLDNYWWAFVIAFGIVAILWLALFSPHW